MFKKLDYIKVKTIFIKSKKRIISYKIKLFKDAKVYFLFSIILLELINSKTHI